MSMSMSMSMSMDTCMIARRELAVFWAALPIRQHLSCTGAAESETQALGLTGIYFLPARGFLPWRLGRIPERNKIDATACPPLGALRSRRPPTHRLAVMRLSRILPVIGAVRRSAEPNPIGILGCGRQRSDLSDPVGPCGAAPPRDERRAVARPHGAPRSRPRLHVVRDRRKGRERRRKSEMHLAGCCEASLALST